MLEIALSDSARSSSDKDAAWVLRRAFDALLMASSSSPENGNFKSILSAAIKEGAPMFNRGDISGCRRVYERAAQQAMTFPRISGETAEVLAKAVGTASRSASDDEAAWALRRAFDAVLAARPQQPSQQLPRDGADARQGAAATGNLVESSLFAAWGVVNDTVMGGSSSSSVARAVGGGLLFSGRLVTRGGGFAMAAGRPARGNVALPARATGLRVVVAVPGGATSVSSDFRRYKLSLRDNQSDVSWQADFTPNVGAAQSEHRVPFAALLPTWRGQLVRPRAPLDTSGITEVSIGLSKFTDRGAADANTKEGDFELLILCIEPYVV
jgi:hypothetical protein